MEYVPGIKINRIKQLDQLGVDRKRYRGTGIASSTGILIEELLLDLYLHIILS